MSKNLTTHSTHGFSQHRGTWCFSIISPCSAMVSWCASCSAWTHNETKATTTTTETTTTAPKPDLQGTDELGVAHLRAERKRRNAEAESRIRRRRRKAKSLDVEKVKVFSNSFFTKQFSQRFQPCLGLCHPSFHPFGHDLKFHTEEPLDQHLHGTHCTIDHTNSQSKHVTTTKLNVQFYYISFTTWNMFKKIYHIINSTSLHILSYLSQMLTDINIS